MANIIQQFKNAGGDNIYPVAYAQGGMKMDLLWTNPSPNSAFSAQTISLDTSKYDLFLVESRNYYSDDQENTLIVLHGVTSRMFYVADSSTTNYTIKYRLITINPTNVVFGQGKQGNASNDNNVCIPYKIYGIKMSYIVPTSVHGLQYVEV